MNALVRSCQVMLLLSLALPVQAQNDRQRSSLLFSLHAGFELNNPYETDGLLNPNSILDRVIFTMPQYGVRVEHVPTRWHLEVSRRFWQQFIAGDTLSFVDRDVERTVDSWLVSFGKTFGRPSGSGVSIRLGHVWERDLYFLQYAVESADPNSFIYARGVNGEISTNYMGLEVGGRLNFLYYPTVYGLEASRYGWYVCRRLQLAHKAAVRQESDSVLVPKVGVSWIPLLEQQSEERFNMIGTAVSFGVQHFVLRRQLSLEFTKIWWLSIGSNPMYNVNGQKSINLLAVNYHRGKWKAGLAYSFVRDDLQRKADYAWLASHGSGSTPYYHQKGMAIVLGRQFGRYSVEARSFFNLVLLHKFWRADHLSFGFNYHIY